MITVKSGKNPISSPPNTKCHSALFAKWTCPLDFWQFDIRSKHHIDRVVVNFRYHQPFFDVCIVYSGCIVDHPTKWVKITF